MLGDVLLIAERHIAAAHAIATKVVERYRLLRRRDHTARFIVAISGESGSGKSELSHSLALRLKKEGLRPKILHTDNYYRVPPSRRLEERIATKFAGVGMKEYDWPLLKSNIANFRSGRESLMPCVDIVSGEIDRLITDFSKSDILVVDGLYALGIEGIDLAIYIDLTWRETRKNQLLRGKEADDDNRIKVLQREHDDVSSFRNRADLIVDHDYRVVEAADYYDGFPECDCDFAEM